MSACGNSAKPGDFGGGRRLKGGFELSTFWVRALCTTKRLNDAQCIKAPSQFTVTKPE